MREQDQERAECRCQAELNLSDLLRDPMTVSLMTADRVDRGELHSLLDKARCGLRQRGPARARRISPRRICA